MYNLVEAFPAPAPRVANAANGEGGKRARVLPPEVPEAGGEKKEAKAGAGQPEAATDVLRDAKHEAKAGSCP